MLISTEELKKFFCKRVKVNKTWTDNCTYQDWYTTDQLFYGGPLGIFLSIIFLALHVVIYYLNTKIHHDFSKCFPTVTAIPLTCGAILRIIIIILSMVKAGTPSFAVDFFTHIQTVCLSTGFITALFGIICFIFYHMFVLCTGKAPDIDESWSTFFTVQIVGWLLAGTYHFTSFDYRKMPNFVVVAAMWISIVVIIITLLSGLFSLCCCRPRKTADNENPVVKYALTRLLFAITYTVIITPSILAMLLYTSDAKYYDRENNDNFKPWIYKENYFFYRLVEFFGSPFMAICILILPTYRNALIVVFRRKKETPTWATKVGTAGAPLINQAPA